MESKVHSGRQKVTSRRYNHRFQILSLADRFQTTSKPRLKLAEQARIQAPELLDCGGIRDAGLKAT